MIKSRSEMPLKPIEIDLQSSQGNAFYLLSLAKKLAKQLELDEAQVLKDMQAGDYDTLIAVFDDYFGDFVTLYE